MIIKHDEILSIFEALSNKEQNKIISYLLDKSSIKLDVFDYQAKKIISTNSFKEAFSKAFLENHRGHFQTTGNLNFYKSSPSVIIKTITDLFECIIEHRGITPNAMFRELRNQKLVPEMDKK